MNAISVSQQQQAAEIKQQLDSQAQQLDSVRMSVHSVDQRLPNAVIVTKFTPSCVVSGNDTNILRFNTLLSDLRIDPPIVSPAPAYSMDSSHPFKWKWKQGLDESSVADNEIENSAYVPIRDFMLEHSLSAEIVANGTLLPNKELFGRDIFSIIV